MAVLVNYVGMTYGPIAAFLAEFFPGAHPLYVGVGAIPHRQRLGRRPGAVITTSAYVSKGSLGWALALPHRWFRRCASSSALFLMPETRKISIWNPVEDNPARARA